jgi:sugar phosphate isomerase/epimerase
MSFAALRTTTSLSPRAKREHTCRVINRREFLVSAGAIAAAVACRKPSVGASTVEVKRRLGPIGIQLYTVRAQMRADMPGTLAQIAGIGFKKVEFAGYFQRSAKDVRAMLDANGLTSPSTHIGFDAMKVDWDKALDDALTIGQKHLIVPSPPNGTQATVASWQKVADDFNVAGERAAARGLMLGYHNHYTEFTVIDGTSPFEILVTRTDPRYFTLQLDVCWAVRGGADPSAWIAKYPTRFSSLHIKDMTAAPEFKQTELGEGSIDFAKVLRTDLDLGRTVQHVFVEHDQPADPMLFAKNAFVYLSALEY